MPVTVYHGLAVSKGEMILLAKGSSNPFAHRWKFPWFPYHGGLNRGVVSSVVQTFRKKTGVASLVENFLGVFETPWGRSSSFLLLLFNGYYSGGDLNFNKKDFSDLRWFTKKELETLPDFELYNPVIRTVFNNVLENKVLPLNSVHFLDLLKGTILS